MRRLLANLSLAAVMSVVVGAWVVPTVFAWHEAPPVCDNGTGVCVSIDDNYVVPRAVNCCSDSNWAGDVYPNTSTTINNTVSSVRNGFTTNDITFHKGTSGSGDGFCLPQGGVNNDLGFFGTGFDDQLSSDGVTSGLC